MSTPNDFTNAAAAAKFLLSQTPLRPKIGLVLGSGLGGFADELADATRIPYANIPFFPRPTALGHAGQMVTGPAPGVPGGGGRGASRGPVPARRLAVGRGPHGAGLGPSVRTVDS